MATKGLHTYYSTNHISIHVNIANFNSLLNIIYGAINSALYSKSQAIAQSIYRIYEFIKIFSSIFYNM